MRIPWDLEEAVLLINYYFEHGEIFYISNDEAREISKLLRCRAERLSIPVDEKFRNITGIKMQLACVHSVVTDGQHGMANAGKIFYDAYALYKENRCLFDKILKEFYEKYAN